MFSQKLEDPSDRWLPKIKYRNGVSVVSASTAELEEARAGGTDDTRADSSNTLGQSGACTLKKNVATDRFILRIGSMLEMPASGGFECGQVIQITDDQGV